MADLTDALDRANELAIADVGIILMVIYRNPLPCCCLCDDWRILDDRAQALVAGVSLRRRLSRIQSRDRAAQRNDVNGLRRFLARRTKNEPKISLCLLSRRS